MADLFDLGDLPSWLQVPEVDLETATRIRRAVSGWLRDATGLTVWPDPVPDDLWAWAVELAAMVYNNPTSANAETVGATSVQFGDRARRAEILAAARRAYSVAGQPQFSFPEPDWSWTSSTVRG
ncbi:hypothetical protein [Micromonospora maritima]|uniref:hypothetical protein n=1 Tax=Micromonospora maritima TaxID=986711 RepID=UPI00157DA75F|nr:hypothetical protein [Micromonospora maritima]